MKKLTIFLCSLILAFSSVFLFGGCNNKKVIEVNEVTHSIFYAPFYAAINEGYFKDEGYDIKLTNGGGSNVSMTALISGSADIILAGPETVVYVNEQGKEDAPVIFGQLTKRDGSFLIGRTPEPDFEWSDLKGKEVIGGRRGGMPAMTLQYVMEHTGGLTIGEDNTRINLDLAFNMMVPAFEGGTGDYVTMFEPTASDYVSAGKGYKIASVGADSGEIPYTAFITTQKYLTKESVKSEKFLRAVKRGYDYIKNTDSLTVANTLLKSFSGTPVTSIQASIESYKLIDAWCENPAMTETAFNNLLNSMTNAGELTTRPEYSKCVDNTIANKIIK